MSSQATSADRGRRARITKIMSVVDRVGLGLMYALVVAVLPLTAVGFLNRTV
jgi:HD-like signal output (HDOD) protein